MNLFLSKLTAKLPSFERSEAKAGMKGRGGTASPPGSRQGPPSPSLSFRPRQEFSAACMHTMGGAPQGCVGGVPGEAASPRSVRLGPPPTCGCSASVDVGCEGGPYLGRRSILRRRSSARRSTAADEHLQFSASTAAAQHGEGSDFCGGWHASGGGAEEGEGVWDTDCTSESGMGASTSLQSSMLHEAARWFPHTNIYARMKDNAQSQFDKKHECRDAGERQIHTNKCCCSCYCCSFCCFLVVSSRLFCGCRWWLRCCCC